MLAVLAAATLAAAQPAEAGPRVFVAPEGPAQKVYLGKHARCPSEGRMQVADAEPALLFREQDRDAARLKKLIELPPGQFCLTGAAAAQRRAPR